MDNHQDKLVKLLECAGPKLHALLLRLTLRDDAAGDLMQDLFIKLSRSSGFHRSREPAAYAYRTATNLAFNWRRSQKPRRQVDVELIDPPDQAPSPLTDLIRNEQLHRILDAMRRLSALSRQAVVMRYIQQESFDTVAHHLGKTPHQVRAITQKAICRLRYLTRECDDEHDGGG